MPDIPKGKEVLTKINIKERPEFALLAVQDKRLVKLCVFGEIDFAPDVLNRARIGFYGIAIFFGEKPVVRFRQPSMPKIEVGQPEFWRSECTNGVIMSRTATPYLVRVVKQKKRSRS